METIGRKYHKVYFQKETIGHVCNSINEINCISSYLGGSSTPSSCKYATLSEKGLGSPQDLSLTTSSSMTPHGAAAVPVTTPSSTPSTRHESSGKSNKASNSSSHRHSSSKSSNHQSVVAASSPSSVSSVSSGSQSDPHSPGPHGDESNSKNANAPQIYPWMKRVHLGQSKPIQIHSLNVTKESLSQLSLCHTYLIMRCTDLYISLLTIPFIKKATSWSIFQTWIFCFEFMAVSTVFFVLLKFISMVNSKVPEYIKGEILIPISLVIFSNSKFRIYNSNDYSSLMTKPVKLESWANPSSNVKYSFISYNWSKMNKFEHVKSLVKTRVDYFEIVNNCY